MLIVCIYTRYYEHTWQCTSGGIYIRSYLIGMIVLLSLVILVLMVLINQSAQGSITDVESRRHVAPILYFKLFLIVPETVLNVFGTMWGFCKDVIVCPYQEDVTQTVVEGTRHLFAALIDVATVVFL